MNYLLSERNHTNLSTLPRSWMCLC